MMKIRTSDIHIIAELAPILAADTQSSPVTTTGTPLAAIIKPTTTFWTNSVKIRTPTIIQRVEILTHILGSLQLTTTGPATLSIVIT